MLFSLFITILYDNGLVHFYGFYAIHIIFLLLFFIELLKLVGSNDQSIPVFTYSSRPSGILHSDPVLCGLVTSN